MQYVDSWASEDRKSFVYFRPEVIRTFERHRQTDDRQSEAGGILLGCRRGRHFEIVHATAPFLGDKQWRTGFIRNKRGHQEVATSLWKASHGAIGYVGEWHTHPELMPIPSFVDYCEWRQLVSRTPLEIPLIVVIAGITVMYVAQLAQKQFTPLIAAIEIA